MSTPASFASERTLLVISEHAARFSLMVNAGVHPHEALARTLEELGEATGQDPPHLAVLLWGVLLDELVEMETGGE